MTNSAIQAKVTEFERAHAALFEDGWIEDSAFHPLRLVRQPDETIHRDGAGIFRRFGKLIARSQYGGVSYREFSSVDDAKLVMATANMLP